MENSLITHPVRTSTPPVGQKSDREFEDFIAKIDQITDCIGRSAFLSPYSIVPIISQLIGLESPMMGTGGSPYSIISFSGAVGRCKALFHYEASLPVHIKRRLIDDLSEMITPILLGQVDEYIALLMKTKYASFVHKLPPTEVELMKKSIAARIAALRPLVCKLMTRKGTFAHIAHYGCLDDLYREQGFLESLGENARKEWFANSYPVVIELQIKGFGSETGVIGGWIIFVPNSTEHLLSNEKIRKKKLLHAGILAERLGANIVGLAGLVASFSRGGRFFVNRIKTSGFTTGHAYTVANIVSIARTISDRVNLNLRESTVALVGAAGSIGSGVAKLFALQGIRNFILVDCDDMVASRKLQLLQETITSINDKSRIVTTGDLRKIRAADLVVVATSATESIIKSDHIKEGALIIDDSFPKNVPRSLLQDRDDLVLLEGGITQMPLQIDVNASRNIPDLLDVPMIKFVSTKQTYGCFAETLILAAMGHKGHYGLGDASTDLALDIAARAASLNVGTATLQAFGIPVEDARINKVKGIIKNR